MTLQISREGSQQTLSKAPAPGSSWFCGKTQVSEWILRQLLHPQMAATDVNVERQNDPGGILLSLSFPPYKYNVPKLTFDWLFSF